MTTSELLSQPIQIIINRDTQGFAQGSLLLDQGIRISEITSNQHEYYTIQHQAKSIQFQLAAGQRGQQQAFVDKFVIANASDLQYVSFACIMTPQNTFISLKKPTFDSVTNTVSITTDGTVKFSDVLNVYYGSQHDGDLNLCDPISY